jgi:hypothetical protein
MDIDDGLGYAGIAELVQHMIEQRPAGHLHQRLWQAIRQRPHAKAETGGKNHGFGWFDWHSGNISNPCSQPDSHQ